jgi:hypothetical protein
MAHLGTMKETYKPTCALTSLDGSTFSNRLVMVEFSNRPFYALHSPQLTRLVSRSPNSVRSSHILHDIEESMSALSHNTEDKLIVSKGAHVRKTHLQHLLTVEHSGLGVNRSALSLDRGSANPDELWRNLCRDLRQFSASISSHLDEDAHPDLDHHSQLSALVLQLDQVWLERLRAQAQLSASIYDCE